MWKDFLYFSRLEKQGIIILAILICAVMLTGTGLSMYRKSQLPVSSENFDEEYSHFIASLKKQDSITHATRRGGRNDYKPAEKEMVAVTLAPFDPNLADSIAFRQLGLPAWMARNILHYRRKGGRFRTPQDFRKIYGMTDEQYQTLLPYIYIGDAHKRKDTVQVTAGQRPAVRPDTLKSFKYPMGTMISLNAADTMELKKIPGIGSALARRIVGYRQRLGGFYHIKQLQEIDLDADQFAPWFHVGNGETTRINLNKVSVERLKAHPYFSFYQAKVIIEHRKRKGNIKRLEHIAFYDEFTDDDLERIGHYVCFE